MSIGTLGPVSANLIRELKKKNQDIFGTSEAQKITGLTPNATTDLLSELVKRKVITRLKPGKYLILPLEVSLSGEYIESWYVVAAELIKPHPYYICYYSAMALHNMITQPILTIYISTPARRQKRRLGGGEFRFIYVKKGNIWGTKKEWVTKEKQIIVSDLERTIIDSLLRPDLCGGITEVAKGIWRRRLDIDYQKLIQYTQKIKVKAVAKRLGFLLETYELNPDGILNKLRAQVKPNRSYVLLDPLLPKKGRFLSRWRLLINTPLEELKQVIRT